MECLRFLFISGLLFKIATALVFMKKDCPLDRSEYRLPVKGIVCRHYNIKLISMFSETDPDEFFEGEANYLIEIYEKTDRISLHYSNQSELDEHIIGSSRLTYPSNITYQVFISNRYIYCPATQILTIDFEDDLPLGNYTLDIKFRSALITDSVPGFSKITYFNKQEQQNGEMFAMNFPWAARTVFPCWDEPTLKATFDISVKHPFYYTVLSNMPIQEQIVEDHMIWTHFNTTPLMPTYLVGVVIFNNFAVITSGDGSINMWGRREIIDQLISAHEVAVQCSNYILTAMNFTKKISKMDLIAIPPSFLRTKSNYGIYIYKESDLIQGRTELEKQSLIAQHLIQTLMYHWFNDVNPAQWNYLWMNDGIVTFFGLYITNKLFEQLRVIDRFVVENQQQLLSEDIVFHVNPVMHDIVTPKEIDILFSGVMQKKATALVRMMYHAIPDETFRKGIRIYLKANQFLSVTPDNLWKALEKAMLCEIEVPDDWDLEKVMDNWLSTSNYPVLDVKHYSIFQRIVITQQNLYMQESENFWWLPITYTTESNLNFDETSPNFWLKPSDKHKHISNIPNGWVIFNLQQTGYYRVNYNMENWRRLTNYLKSDNYKKIHPINRAQLIDDSYHLMLAGHLDGTVFLELSSYLKQERDYIPWYPMKRILSNMTTFFRFPESASIKKHMRVILNNVLEDIGYKDNFDDTNFTKLLRLLVLELICKLGNAMCLTMANTNLVAYLENPDAPDIQPLWEEWIFCMGMKNADDTSWSRMINEYMLTKKSEYLDYLNCAESSILICDYISKLVSNYFHIGKHERLRIIRNILKRHASDDLVLDYILTNYNLIRTIAQFSIIDFIIPNIYSVEQLQKVEKFVISHQFSEEEMEFPVNYTQRLISSIATQSKNIRTEIKMFTNQFNISETKMISI
ncbi:aminopeptidase N-like isoform X2 [Odontomachus brunneus]|uniref:aminopeptidase N-like isoform X2 n=1 Tax=Odontomachus brunneus TaxID=486640 RepID=UPI0013F1DE7B|nr:aminopeptidase N-like isoform X2 [Odontomachus brunneus]